jgi:hypothetical protein
MIVMAWAAPSDSTTSFMLIADGVVWSWIVSSSFEISRIRALLAANDAGSPPQSRNVTVSASGARPMRAWFIAVSSMPIDMHQNSTNSCGGGLDVLASDPEGGVALPAGGRAALAVQGLELTRIDLELALVPGGACGQALGGALLHLGERGTVST